MVIVWVVIAFIVGGMFGAVMMGLCCAHDPYQEEGRDDE